MGRMWRAATVLLLGVGLGLGLNATAASAHDEREPRMPNGTGHVPTYRTDGPRLLVCKTDQADFGNRIAGFDPATSERNQALWAECQRSGYRHLQEAVDNVRLPGTTILVLPGLYREEPSLAPPSGTCASLDARWAGNNQYQVLSWEQQVACPHVQNLVAVLDKKDLQIEGTGARPEDVVIDAQFQKLNGIRADRADGFYVRNLTAQRTTFNAIYILETDGFVIDRTIGRWNDEYGFLTFATDHGLYTDCEAYGNGDSGVYPGAASNINAGRGHDVPRYAIEIRGCRSHHNALGYSGTAGDSVWAHDNEFVLNGAGVATDSAFPDHPGMPQNHAKFERNVIADNNVDYYRYVRDGTCAKPFAERGYESGVVCPVVGIPTGTGVINPGGNYNIWRDNWVYNNEYAGFVTSWVPGFVRNDTSFGEQFDTSHHNRYVDNKLGLTRAGESRPNGMDFWWDGQGIGSCWQPGSVAEPMTVPGCDGLGTQRYVGELGKTLKMYVCADYSRDATRIPVNCEWFGARGLERIEVQYALGEAILVFLVLLALALRRARSSRRALAGVALASAGLAVGVFGTVYETTPLTGIGLLLLGAGWVLVGLALRRGLRVVTVALGVLGVLGAVDRALVMLPWIPVAPSLPRILLELVWVPWALVAAVRGDRTGTAESAAPAPATESVEAR